ncbi:MAG: hypothetical protein KAX40_06770 [Herpetosiphon sp.]|nr:hypothetical protein [Herpetosiphon sp.]
MAKRPQRARKNVDIEEIAPNTFLIHNVAVRAVLRGEGDINGHTFTLTSTRRLGLLARLRQRNFKVSSLEDKVHRLPKMPYAPKLGEALPVAIGARDQWSYFHPDDLVWRDVKAIERQQHPVVMLREGALVRRRRSRTEGDFFQVDRTAKGGANLLGLNETEAILRGYAQATEESDIEIEAEEREHGYLLPLDFVLPPAYATFIRSLGMNTPEGWLFDTAAWRFVLQALHRLNLRPAVGDYDVETDAGAPVDIDADDDDYE